MIGTQEYFRLKNQDYDSLINISGRQRILSQKIALLKILNNPKLKKNLDLFESSQFFLYSTASAHIKKYYDKELTKAFIDYISLINIQTSKKEIILKESELILGKLNRAVQLFENESNYHEKQLFYSNIFFVFIITVSIIIIYFKLLNKQRLKIINYLTSYSSEKQKAIEASNAKTLFLANMSHELRTPLNGVINLGISLKETNLNEKQIHYVNTIINAGKVLSNIINDILDFSKLESSNISTVKQNLSVPELVFEVESLLLPKAIEKKLSFKYENDPSTPEYIISDPLRLKQILINLINNAIKFTKSGGVIIKSFSKNDRIIFEIIDTGIGIKDEDIKSIFDNFTQVENTYVKSQEGTGLGLSITKKIVMAFGGSISVDSQFEKGTTVRVELPLIIGSKIINKDLPSEPTPIKALPISLQKILVAEDNKINQIVIKDLLTKLKLNFDIANNGLEAIDLFKTNQYDLILMDISMPLMNGFDTTAAIREINKNVPIFCLSANVFEDDKKKALENGMNEFLKKPINREEFILLLNKYLP